MTLPSFLIVGAQKCGTTTLFDILNEHPEVNMSKIKEVNFFNSKTKYKKGLEYYSSFFKKPDKIQKITGEATPGYMNSKGVANKIKKDLGNVKIVMILRDPIKRAYSQYWDNRRHLKENLSENLIIDRYLDSNYNQNTRGYFSRGVYFKYIEEYLRHFNRDDLHIIIFEDLVREPEKELFKLYSFLEINTSKKFLKLSRSSNSSLIWVNGWYNLFFKYPNLNIFIPKYLRKFFFFGKKKPFKYPLPSDQELNILQKFYEPWNNKLEMFLGIDLSNWTLSKKKSLK